MNRIPVSLVVLTGNFRIPRNKGKNKRELSQRVLTSCVSSGLAYPLSDEIGEKTHSRLSFGERQARRFVGKEVIGQVPSIAAEGIRAFGRKGKSIPTRKESK